MLSSRKQAILFYVCRLQTIENGETHRQTDKNFIYDVGLPSGLMVLHFIFISLALKLTSIVDGFLCFKIAKIQLTSFVSVYVYNNFFEYRIVLLNWVDNNNKNSQNEHKNWVI